MKRLKNLSSFIKEQYHKNDLHIKDVNFKFLTDFEVYLRGLKPKDHRKAIGNRRDDAPDPFLSLAKGCITR